MMLDQKSVRQRALIAQDLGARLNATDASASDRRAAEALARELASDAIDLVRQELSKSLRHCRFLPRDIALKIVRDVDSVACPFLEVTEVFSEDDWQQLIATASSGARCAIARRANLTETMINTLAEVGDACVAEALLGNELAPIKRHGYTILVQRFGDAPQVLERLAARRSLPSDVAVGLISKVSEAAREKLVRLYELEDFTHPLVDEAQSNALLWVIRRTPKDELAGYAESLKRTGELGPSLMLKALRMGMIEFFEDAMALRAGVPAENIRVLVRSGSDEAITRLFEKGGLPKALWPDFHSAITAAQPDADGPRRRPG